MKRKDWKKKQRAVKRRNHENFEIVSLRPGQIVKGKILHVSDDELIVNVGYKSDGVVAR